MQTELRFVPIDSADTVVNKTSVLVVGTSEAVLIDPPFSSLDAERVISAVLSTGCRLTTVLATNADPAGQVGANVLAAAFPAARFLAPTQIVTTLMSRQRDPQAISAQLGVSLPTSRVVFEPLDEVITVDSYTLEVRQASSALRHRGWFVFEPRHRALLGGALLFHDLHVWIPDSGGPAGRLEWSRALDGLAELRPNLTIAGHRRRGSTYGTAAITHTQHYLRRFDEIVRAADDPLIAAMRLRREFHGAGMVVAALLGAAAANAE